MIERKEGRIGIRGSNKWENEGERKLKEKQIKCRIKKSQNKKNLSD